MAHSPERFTETNRNTLGGLALLFSVAAAPYLAGQSEVEKLPPAEELFERHIEATGGKHAHVSHQTRIKIGKLAVDVGGHKFEAKTTEKSQAPDKIHVVMDGDFFFQVNVCDGERAWEWRAGHAKQDGKPNMDSGETTLLEGSKKTQAINQARFRGALEWQSRYSDAHTVGIVDVGGAPAYEVRVTTKAGREYSQFYDKETGRLVKRIRTNSTNMGEIEVEAFMEDYREFDGIWYAMRVRAVLHSPSFGEGTQIWTYSKITHDEKISPSLFELPEDLRAGKDA